MKYKTKWPGKKETHDQSGTPNYIIFKNKGWNAAIDQCNACVESIIEDEILRIIDEEMPCSCKVRDLVSLDCCNHMYRLELADAIAKHIKERLS